MKVTTATQALAASQADNVLLLTGNNRQQRGLLDAWAKQQQQQGLGAWRSPNVLAYRTWLRELWRQSMGGLLAGWQGEQSGYLLLSASQAEQLWLNAVQRDNSTQLISQTTAAKEAYQSWCLLQQWQLQNKPLPAVVSADTEAFERWRQVVEKQMLGERWLDASQLPSVLSAMVSDGCLALPEHIFTLGLEQLSPAENNLIATLADAGVGITAVTEARTAGQKKLLVSQSPAQEIKDACAWLQQQLKLAPEQRLAVVMLNASQQLLPLQRELKRCLHPQRAWAAATTEPLAFNSSVGEPLAKQPLVRVALLLLRWLQQALPVQAAAAVVQSPWFAGFQLEQSARERLAKLLIECDQQQVSVAKALHEARRQQLPCVALVSQLEAAREAFQQTREQPPQTAREWLSLFNSLLDLSGWARLNGEASLDSRRWQTAQRFQQLLQDLCELDLVVPRFTARDTLQALESAAEAAVFQPQGSDAPVQLLGPLEAIGQQFDAVWVLGATDESLPAALRLDPYIPKLWQRDYDMPRASVQRELAIARQWIDSICQSAAQIVFSYPKAEGETPFRVSRLLQALQIAQAPQPSTSQSWLDGLPGQLRSEWLADQQAPVISGTHPVHASGGTALFQDQAACGFRAFAHWRLNTRAIRLPSWGLSASDLGIRLHQVLEIFWCEHKSHAALLAMDEMQLKLAVRTAIAKASEQSLASVEPSLQAAMQDLEMAMFEPMLLQWLALEKGREPFRVVENEEKLEVKISRLVLAMQVDRIDQLDDGSVVVIDYKTSKHLKIAAWNPPRPEQPQLPLYAVELTHKQQKVAAVMFAQLSTSAIQPLGLATREGVMQGLDLGDESADKPRRGGYQPSLSELLPEWESELIRLADEFVNGQAGVLPKSADSCRYCDLQPLCRVNWVAEQEPADD